MDSVTRTPDQSHLAGHVNLRIIGEITLMTSISLFNCLMTCSVPGTSVFVERVTSDMVGSEVGATFRGFDIVAPLAEQPHNPGQDTRSVFDQ